MATGLFLTLSLTAQTVKTDQNWSDTITSQGVFDRLFIEFGGGTQILFSQDADELKTAQRFTPHFSLSAGTWFSPNWGAGLLVEGTSLNGFTDIGSSVAGSYFEDDPVRQYVTIRPDGNYRHYIRYTDASILVFASLFNLLAEDNKLHRFNVIPSAGIGWMHVFSYKGIPENNVLTYRLGLSATFGITPGLSLALKGSGLLAPNDFEGRDAGSATFDKIGSFDIGLIWNLKH